MNISIIITTYNWCDALEIILKTLIPQIKRLNKHGINNQLTDVELIIADDGSTAETKNIIYKYQQELPHIKHIWHEDLGFRRTVILNEAVRQSNGEYILFLDGDCIPFPDYIEQHVKLAERGYFVAGNRILLSPLFTQHILNNHAIINRIFQWNWLKWLWHKFISKNVNKIIPWLRLNKTNKFRYLNTKQWKYPKGCNFATWRKDFINVNGFDELFIGWGHEDSDLFVRLLHSGVLIKNGRFAVPVLHLWHKEASRDNQSNNYKELIARSQNPNFIRSQRGLDNK